MNQCRFCDSSDMAEVFSLGEMPAGYPIETAEMNHTDVWLAELLLLRCANCELVQTANTIPAGSLTDNNRYLSSTARAVSEHDRHFVEKIPDKISLESHSMILEIGCGDGSLLEAFWKKGYENLIGVEPVPHPSKEYHFDLIENFFTREVVNQLESEGVVVDCILANYVIELIPEIDEFFDSLIELMNDDTVAIFEVPYFLEFVDRFRIDGFAHLRCNWFTVTSLLNILSEYGLYLDDLDYMNNYRGGTLQATVRKGYRNELPEKAMELLAREDTELSRERLTSLPFEVNRKKRKLQESLRRLTSEQRTIGYGGGLKASTLINWLGLTVEEVPMIVDQDPHKQGRVVPGAGIPIHSVETLETIDVPVSVLLLALDHAEEIQEFLDETLPNKSRVIHPLPEPMTREI